MTPIDFDFPWSKVKVKLLVFKKLLSAQYLLTQCLKVSKLGTVNASIKQMTPIIVQVKGQCQTVGLNPKCCLLKSGDGADISQILHVITLLILV